MLTDRLKQLGDEFLKRTRDELLLLRAQLPQARAGQADALLEVQRIAHRISGSGALLGFKTMSEAAMQIERILRRAEPVPTVDEWLAMEAQLQTLETELAALTADPDVSH